MLPQTFAYGVDARLALLIAGATLIGVIGSFRRFSLPKGTQMYLLGALWAVYGLCSLVAVNPSAAIIQFSMMSKIFLMAFVMMGLVTTETRLKNLIYVVAFSIGFLGFIQCLRFIITGGVHLSGIGGNFSDNNDFALGVNMALPFLWYLIRDIDRKSFKIGVAIFFAAGVVTVIGTYSRGGFLTLATVFLFIWAKSKRKVSLAAIILFALIMSSSLIPESYMERLETIRTYSQDQSAMTRLLNMHTAWNIFVEHPWLGVGLGNMLLVYYDYVPVGADPKLTQEAFVAHDTYLQIGAEAGTAGLLVYLFLIFRSLWVLNRIQNRHDNDLSRPLVRYSRMTQGGIAAAIVGTFFLSRIQLELIYVLFAFVAILERFDSDAEGGVHFRDDANEGAPKSNKKSILQ